MSTEHCQTALCNRSTRDSRTLRASLMNLLLTILTLSGMSTSGSLRVKHATRRRDLGGTVATNGPRSAPPHFLDRFLDVTSALLI